MARLRRAATATARRLGRAGVRASLYTRQTNLAAPAAAFALLLAARPRSARTLFWSTAAPGLAVLAALSAATDGEFLLHILLYNINRIVWAHAGQLAAALATCAVLVALGLLGAGRSWRRIMADGGQAVRARLAERPAAAAQAAVLAMLAFKTLMLPMVLKSGASDNYLLDWLAPLAVMAALASAPVIRAALEGNEAGASAALIAMLGLGLPAQVIALAEPRRGRRGRCGADPSGRTRTRGG